MKETPWLVLPPWGQFPQPDCWSVVTWGVLLEWCPGDPLLHSPALQMTPLGQ